MWNSHTTIPAISAETDAYASKFNEATDIAGDLGPEKQGTRATQFCLESLIPVEGSPMFFVKGGYITNNVRSLQCSLVYAGMNISKTRLDIVKGVKFPVDIEGRLKFINYTSKFIPGGHHLYTSAHKTICDDDSHYSNKLGTQGGVRLPALFTTQEPGAVFDILERMYVVAMAPIAADDIATCNAYLTNGNNIDPVQRVAHARQLVNATARAGGLASVAHATLAAEQRRAEKEIFVYLGVVFEDTESGKPGVFDVR